MSPLRWYALNSYWNRQSKNYPIDPFALLKPKETSWQHKQTSQDAWNNCWCHSRITSLWIGQEVCWGFHTGTPKDKDVHINQVEGFDTEDGTGLLSSLLLLLLKINLFPGGLRSFSLALDSICDRRMSQRAAQLTPEHKPAAQSSTDKITATSFYFLPPAWWVRNEHCWAKSPKTGTGALLKMYF